MKKESTLIVCNLGGIDHRDHLGELVDTRGLRAPVHAEIFSAVKHYLNESDRVTQLLQGQGIATCTDGTILREWRRVDEVVRPMVFNKIAQLPSSERNLWYLLMYRTSLRLCFLLPARSIVQRASLDELSLVRSSVRARGGQIASLVACDPVEAVPKRVLKLATSSNRFSTVTPSKANAVRGLTVVSPDHYLVSHPIVQKILQAG